MNRNPKLVKLCCPGAHGIHGSGNYTDCASLPRYIVIRREVIFSNYTSRTKVYIIICSIFLYILKLKINRLLIFTSIYCNAANRNIYARVLLARKVLKSLNDSLLREGNYMSYASLPRYIAILRLVRETAKKLGLFLVARPLRPYPPPRT